LLKIIAASCQIKASVVEQDEKENDLRAILNYGHTIGHAIETVTHYKRYRHGEAVAVGMLYATKIAMELGLADRSVFDRQLSLIKNLGVSIQTGLKSEALIKALYTDKKTISGKLRFVLPIKIGEVIISDKVNEEILYRVLDKPL